MINMEKKIFNCLNELGIAFNLSGREYLEQAIMLVSGKGEISITKDIYAGIAEKNGTTAAKVGRGIRSAIETCFDNAEEETLRKYFGNTVSFRSGKMTNASFIRGVAKYIKVFESEAV